MKKVHLIAAIVSVVLLLSLAACAPTTNKGSSSTHESDATAAKLENNGNAVRYIRKRIPLPDDKYIIKSIQMSGEQLYWFGYQAIDDPNNFFIYISDIDGNIDRDRQIRCIWEDEYTHAIQSSFVEPDGTIWLLEYLWEIEYNADGTKANETLKQWIVEKIDENGFAGAIICSDEYVSHLDAPLRIAVSEEKIYLTDERGLLAYSKDGSLLGQNTGMSIWDVPFLSPEGALMLIRADVDGYSLIEISPSDYSVVGSLPLGENFRRAFKGNGAYEVLLDSGSSLYGVSRNSTSRDEILNWFSVGLMGDTQGVLALDGLRLLYYTSREVYLLEPSEKNDEDVITLTLGLMDKYPLANAIMEFNSSNPDYCIEVHDYSQYNTKDKPNGGLLQLNLDIVSGNGPDIFDLTSLPIDQYTKSGLLEDLYPFIENDEELAAKPFVSTVIKAMETDGRLYALIPAYGIMTIEGRKSQLDPYGDISFQSLLKMNQEKEGALGIFGESMSKRLFLETMLSVSNSVFMDWDSGECHFTDDEFIALLELAKELPDDYDLGYVSQMIQDGEQWLSVMGIGGFFQIIADNYYFNGDMAFYGLPSARGSGSVIVPEVSLGISAACSDKAGAWEFLKMFLMDKYQADKGLTITESALTSALNEIREITVDGEAYLSTMDRDGEVEIEVTLEEYEPRFRSLLDSVVGVYSYNPELIEIVWGEAQAYFAGQKSAEEVAKLIQSRVSIYISEQG